MRLGSAFLFVLVALFALGFLLSESINVDNHSEATQQPLAVLLPENAQLGQQIVILLLIAFILGVMFGVNLTRPKL